MNYWFSKSTLTKMANVLAFAAIVVAMIGVWTTPVSSHFTHIGHFLATAGLLLLAAVFTLWNI